MKYRITHKTAYRYSEPASLSQNELFLHPRETGTQRVVQSRLTIVPEPQYLHRRTDYFGNIVYVFMVQQPHNELSMTAASIVETRQAMVPAPADTPPWESVAQRLAAPADPAELAACQFVFGSPLAATAPGVLTYGQPSFPPGRPVLVGAMNLIQRIFTEFTYDKSATTVDTTVDQVLAKRKGVCQDFAHLAIGCLRALGLAARYVSGYLETKPPPGKPKLVGADASHAWISVFVPDAGWVDLDPTNNLIAGENHITLAWGRDYGDVTPVKGVVMGGGIHTLSVLLDVAAQT
ncbi:MAG: transglutaminase family protein [Desulfobacteraceae bacterium]|nr:transglutaminase family protein [Desulfobacteraceae bacterium]